VSSLLSVPGLGNFTFSFLGASFAKAIMGSSLSSSGSDPKDSSQSGDPNQPSIAAVDATRALLSSNLPILAVSCLALASFAIGVIFVLFKLCVVSSSFAQSRRKKLTEKDARDSATMRFQKGGEVSYRLPYSLARSGVPAMYHGQEMYLIGQTYALRAQTNLFDFLSLTSILLDAHKKLKPEHLAYAEEDGVFESNVPGLFFIVPYFWDDEKTFRAQQERYAIIDKRKLKELPKRRVAEGYKVLLSKWCTACEKVGSLDRRAQEKEKWENWSWQRALEAINKKKKRRNSKRVEERESEEESEAKVEAEEKKAEVESEKEDSEVKKRSPSKMTKNPLNRARSSSAIESSVRRGRAGESDA